MPQTHRAPFRIPLCPSLEMRYSISVSAASHERYACGYLNRARYYFYSPALKKQVGKEWQATYPFTKKEIKAAKGGRPSVYEPKDTDLQEALENLLNRNKDLTVIYRKTKRGKPINVQLNTDELLVFWVTQFSSVYNLVTSSQSPEELNKRMAKVFMNPQIASFDLTSLVAVEQPLRESAYKSLVSQVKKTITGRKSDLTGGVNQTVLLIRYAVNCYLTSKKVNPERALGKSRLLGLHVDQELHDKLKYLAASEGRSINHEVLYLIRREIEAFEKEYSKIKLPDKAEE